MYCLCSALRSQPWVDLGLFGLRMVQEKKFGVKSGSKPYKVLCTGAV